MGIIKVGERIFEDASTLRERLGGLSEMGLYAHLRNGMPRPIKIGKRRWFDRGRVDGWLIGLALSKPE